MNSAVEVFASLELTAEKHEAIQLLQNAIKTLESSLELTNNEQKNNITVNSYAVSAGLKSDGEIGNLTTSHDVVKLSQQDVEEFAHQNEMHHGRVPKNTCDVSIQKPNMQEKFTSQECQKKDESFMGENTIRDITSHSTKDVVEMRKLISENNHLKDKLWKLVSVNSGLPLVTPSGRGGTNRLIKNVLEELISKVVFYAELSRGPVETVDLVQPYLMTSTSVTAKRKRGRPPKNKQLSPEVSVPPTVETRQGRRRNAQGKIKSAECQAEEEGRRGKGRKRNVAQDEGTGGIKRRKTTDNDSVSVLEDDSRQDVKTELLPSGGVTIESNADSDSTVIYDELADSDALTQKQQSMKRTLKTNQQSKMPAMPARHKCKICRAAFSHGRPFKRHLVNHGEGDTSCRRCHNEFQNYALFLHHQCRGDPTCRLRRGIEQKCTLCDETFHNRKKVQHHMNTVHCRKLDPMFFCEYCNKGFVKQTSLYVHYKQHADGQNVCAKCGHFFEDETLFIAHENAHSGCGNYTCKKCDETFEYRQLYLRHMAGHRKCDCIVCGQTFSTSKMLVQHREDMHGVEVKNKKYGCDYCGKKYPRPGLLELHLRTHTGEYKCQALRAILRIG